MEYYSAIKKAGNSAICDNMMNLEGGMLSKASKTEKDKHNMISHVGAKKTLNLQKQILLVARGGSIEKMHNGVKRYKLGNPCMSW